MRDVIELAGQFEPSLGYGVGQAILERGNTGIFVGVNDSTLTSQCLIGAYSAAEQSALLRDLELSAELCAYVNSGGTKERLVNLLQSFVATLSVKVHFRDAEYIGKRIFDDKVYLMFRDSSGHVIAWSHNDQVIYESYDSYCERIAGKETSENDDFLAFLSGLGTAPDIAALPDREDTGTAEQDTRDAAT